MNIKNLRNLNHFTGGDTYFVNPIGRLRYSEGVRYLAENADCYWLIDAIASYQPKLGQIDTFRYLQFWNLIVNEDRAGVLACREDSGIEPVVRQEIEYTDFPLAEIDLWVEHGMLILPSEH